MHKVFVVSSLGGGGAEKIAVLMANFWAERGEEVSFILFANASEPHAYTLHSSINVVYLNKRGDSRGRIQGLFNAASRVRALRQALKKIRPAVVIPFLDRTNICAVLAAWGLSIPTVITEHNVPSQNTLPFPWEPLRRYTYPRASRLVVLTEETQKYYLERWKLESIIIPNPVAPAPLLPTYTPQSPPRIVALGRLEPVKGFTTLIQCMKRVHLALPLLHLEIWGEGSQRAHLESLSKSLNLEECISLKGRTNDVYAPLSRSDLLILTSHHEAFPNVILEAFTAGVPVVALDCPSGPRAIIDSDKNGALIAPDHVELLADKIIELINDPLRRTQMSAAAKEKSKTYELVSIMRRWDELLNQMGVSIRG
jgi:GalNAc-alpha-(1->4)-GalNAc-alpha-(1->3)-diNAcBac-PP-undecaprenol alpha-1,4-N-acetyl-D-galactosaminyltransferase